MSDALSLELLREAFMAGGEGAVLHTLNRINGNEMIQLTQMDYLTGRMIGNVHVVVSRVHGIGPHFLGGTVLSFRDPCPDHKKTIAVMDELRRVERRLNEGGWNNGKSS